MTLNLIETLNKIIYSPKDTKITKLHDRIYKKKHFLEIHICRKKKTVFYGDLYGIIYIVEGPHSLTSFITINIRSIFIVFIFSM